MASRRTVRAAVAQPSPVTTAQTQPATAAFTPDPLKLAICRAMTASFTVAAVWSPLVQAQAADAQADAATAAQTDTVRQYNIPPGPLSQVLTRFSTESAIFLGGATDLAEGKGSPGLQGRYTVEQALRTLLADSGLSYRFAGGNRVTLVAAQEDGGSIRTGPITVEGAAGPRLGTAEFERDEGFKADYQVSTTKTPLLIRETPQSISVITRDSIEARLALDVETALELAAGVTAQGPASGTFAGSGRFNAGRFILRGQQLDNTRDVRIDGFAGGDFATAPDIALLERVEVIKGPSASLYGTGSLSGFVNRVTKKPQAERAASIVAAAGSFDTYRTEFDVTGALDAEENYSARLIGAYENSGAFVDRVDSEVKLIAPMFAANLGDRTRTLIQGYYQEQGGTPSEGVPLRVSEDGELSAPPDIRRSQFPGVAGGSEVNNDEYFISALLEHELSDRWLASLRLQRGETRTNLRTDAYAFGLYGNGETYLYSGAAQTETDAWAGELRLDGGFSLFGSEHRLVAGLEKRELERLGGANYAYAGSGNLYSGEFNAMPAENLDTPDTFLFPRLRTEAAYAQLMLSLTPGTRLIGGLRYEDAEQRARLRIGTPNESDDTADDSEITWRLGLSQDLGWGLTGFATYATTFVPVTNVGPTGSVLDPETGDGMELGLKGEWFDNQLGATFSVYRQERDNVPLALSRDECLAGGAGLTSCSRSAGTQEFEGVELEISGNPLPELTLGLAMSWQDGEFTERSDPNFDQKATNVIDRQTNLFAQYRFADGVLNGLGLGATLVSLGDRGTLRVGQFAKGYERVDLNFSYDAIPGWDLRLLVRNLFDERYLERVSGPEFQNFFGSPRAALFRAEYKF